jgi:hypothetical protein
VIGLRLDRRRRRLYLGTRRWFVRVHHGAVGVGCVYLAAHVHNRLVAEALIAVGAALAWDDLPDLRRSWWLRDV